MEDIGELVWRVILKTEIRIAPLLFGSRKVNDPFRNRRPNRIVTSMPYKCDGLMHQFNQRNWNVPTMVCSL